MKVILDCDAGVDDLVALLLVLKSVQEGESELLMVGTTFGNSTCAASKRNVECMLDCMNEAMTDNSTSNRELEVGVYYGADGPLCRSSPAATVIWRSRGWPGHGRDGLGGALPHLVDAFDFRYTVEEMLEKQEQEQAEELLLNASVVPSIAQDVADNARHLARQGSAEEIVEGAAGAALEQREHKLWSEKDLPRIPFSQRAPLKMVEALHAAGEAVTVVCIGPLTNLATALALDPSIVNCIGRLVVMGGSDRARGNCSLTAEFNFHADPEAARAVFEAFERENEHDTRIELISWDLTNQYGLSWSDLDRVLAGELGLQVTSLGTKCAFQGRAPEDEEMALADRKPSTCQRLLGAVLAKFCAMCSDDMQLAEETGRPDRSCALCDSLAMLIALDSSIVEDSKNLNATVEIGDGLCSGQVVFDWYGKRKSRANVTLVTQVQPGALIAAISDMVAFFAG